MHFAGLRRISWVTVTVEDGHATAVVHGLGHRFPKTVRISLRAALELAADGTPTVVRHANSTAKT